MKESNNRNIHLLYYLALFMVWVFLATFLCTRICQHYTYKVYVPKSKSTGEVLCMAPSVHVASGRSWGLFPSWPLSVFSMESYCLCIHDSNRVNSTHPHLHPTVRNDAFLSLALSVRGKSLSLCVMYRKGLTDSLLTCKHPSESSRHRQPPSSAHWEQDSEAFQAGRGND